MCFMSCSWCPKVDSRWFVQQHCLGGEGTEKSSWPLYSRGGVGGQDFDKIWLFPFCPNLAQIWKREMENFKVYWSSEAQLRRGIKGRGGISLKQNPKLWEKNIRSLFLGLFDQGNSRQKPFSGTIFHLLFWIIKAWNHCWFRNWILCIFCAASLF